jgi:hypothetical protein
MKIQGREVKNGDTVYLGKEPYQVVCHILTVKNDYLPSVGLMHKKTQVYETISLYEFQQFYRWNPYDIPDDPVPERLDGIKTGDTLFSVMYGNVRVTGIENDGSIAFEDMNGLFVGQSDRDGRELDFHKNPTLFRSASQCAEYFTKIATEEKK